MRQRWLALVLLAGLAVALAPRAGGVVSAAAQSGDQKPAKERRGDEDWPERDEFRQSYTLAPGAQVRVSGINGAVDVETWAGSTADVYVVRSARTREDLDYHKVIVEQTAGGLVVRGAKDDQGRDHDREGSHSVRQRVTLRLPRNIDFTASGVNGRTTIGEIDGPVKLSGINGRVEVAQARGYTDLSGINGAVVATISQLGERGIRVSGVNGRVELRFAGAVNADVSVSGINGSVAADLPNATLQGNASRSSFTGRVGSGGAPINVSGVNGSVHLVPRS